MANLKMTHYESKLPVLKRELQAPKVFSKPEMMGNDYQQNVFREKEQKLLTLFRRQQDYATQRGHGSSVCSSELHHNTSSNEPKDIHALSKQSSVNAVQWAVEERNWASNWTFSKRSAGVDRAHPLKPVLHHKDHGRLMYETSINRSKSANASEPSIPYQEQINLTSGLRKPELWLQKSELCLEAEIRKKEALLLEKLRRTEETLRRIQREKGEVVLLRDIPEGRTRVEHVNAITGNDFNKFHFEGKKKDRLKTQETLHQQSKSKQINQTPKLAKPQLQSAVLKPHAEEMATNNKSKGSLIECVSSKSNPQHSPRNGSQDSSGPDYREDKQRESLPSSTPDSMKLVPCQLCGRQFLVHRLEKHTGVCEKLQKRSRKVFDSSQARAKGTDLEQFLQTKGKRQTQGPKAPSSNWRQKHESFQRTIHQAREVQQVIARGGKLSDLPPPPPEENPDYVPCPHCSRRFAPRAAERHIPKCENIKSKPRPPPARRR